MRNYTEALAQAGYKPLFECAREACGGDVESVLYSSNKQNKLQGKQIVEYAFTMGVSEQRLFVAELKQGGASSYVTVFAAVSGNAAENDIKNRVTVYVEQIQAGKMESRMATVKSSEIQQAMNRDGKVAIYGVLFDTDKSEIKPESAPQLEEMGRYLQQNPSVSVYVVGHTDNQGKLDYNLGLSQRRAAQRHPWSFEQRRAHRAVYRGQEREQGRRRLRGHGDHRRLCQPRPGIRGRDQTDGATA